jgi:hypothetical protein
MTLENKTSEKGMLERFSRLDRRIMFWILLIVIAIPYIKPFSLPMDISEYSMKFYDYIEKLSDKDVVLVSIDIGLGNMGELGGGVIGLAKHLSNKNAKIVGVSTGTDGPIIFETYFRPILEKKGYKYGVDFVNLGFAAGGETMISRIAEDIKTVYSRDHYGNEVNELPLMKDVSDAMDFFLAVTYDTGSTSAFYSRQWEAKYKTPILSIPSAGNFMAINPLVQSGSIAAALNGPRGCAEYEILIREPGMANESITAISVGHLVIIMFIILGNIVYLIEKYRRVR